MCLITSLFNELTSLVATHVVLLLVAFVLLFSDPLDPFAILPQSKFNYV